MTSLTAPCLGDETSLTGVGGAVEILRHHPTIRMVAERVTITDPTSPYVVAWFVFRNDGPATDALIGFPETGYQRAPGKPESPGLANFKSFIDGKPITVTRRMSHQKPPADTDGDYVAFYLKRVHFEPHQTRVRR